MEPKEFRSRNPWKRCSTSIAWKSGEGNAIKQRRILNRRNLESMLSDIFRLTRQHPTEQNIEELLGALEAGRDALSQKRREYYPLVRFLKLRNKSL